MRDMRIKLMTLITFIIIGLSASTDLEPEDCDCPGSNPFCSECWRLPIKFGKRLSDTMASNDMNLEDNRTDVKSHADLKFLICRFSVFGKELSVEDLQKCSRRINFHVKLKSKPNSKVLTKILNLIN